MTEHQAEKAATYDQADQEVTDASATGSAGGDEIATLRKEAAGYRRRLRETEAERDQYREQANELRRAEVERALGERLADPQDLLGSVENIDQFFTDDGKLDAQAVKREADAALAEKPHWRKPQSSFDGGAREAPPVDKTPSFGEALKKAAG